MRWLTVFAFTLVGVVTLIGNRIQAAGNDAVFTQSLVNRAARFGGSYYDNGITPKGPLEDVVHDVALRIGGYDGHFYVISIMIVISAAVLGFTAARTASTTGANGYGRARRGGGRVRALHTVELRLFRVAVQPEHARDAVRGGVVAHARGRVWTGSSPPAVRDRRRDGVLLGLGVQTILPSFFDAIGDRNRRMPCYSHGASETGRRVRSVERRRSRPIVGFVSAPLWYFAAWPLRFVLGELVTRTRVTSTEGSD